MDFSILHTLVREGNFMPDTEKKELNGKRDDVKYAHNPRYCMILPDAGSGYGRYHLYRTVVTEERLLLTEEAFFQSVAKNGKYARKI